MSGVSYCTKCSEAECVHGRTHSADVDAMKLALEAMETVSKLAEHHKDIFEVDWDVGESWLTDEFFAFVEQARAAIDALNERLLAE